MTEADEELETYAQTHHDSTACGKSAKAKAAHARMRMVALERSKLKSTLRPRSPVSVRKFSWDE